VNSPIAVPGLNAEALQEGASHLEALVNRYMSTSLAEHDTAQLDRWLPLQSSLWRRLQPLMGVQAGLQTRCKRVGDHTLSFWEGGNPKGPALLLLHGFGASKENWAFLGARLKSRFRIIAPDQAGFGRSDFHTAADYGLAAQSDRAAALLDDLGVDSAFVVGSSMGGAIAAQLAARHPERVAALGLMNAAGAPGKHMSLLESGLAAGVNYLAPAIPRDTGRVFSIALHRRHRLMGMALAFVMAREMSHRKPVNDFLFTQMVTSLLPTWQGLGNIKAPTLVLWGDSDQVLDASCADSFREQIEHAHVMVMPGVGHLPMLEEPALTAQVLHDFWYANRT
jgi:abhydrolase domain-containing protein 6